jgi:two-component system, NtrC family, sensor histidine kinase KinB
MKKIKTKLMIGIGIIFFISYTIMTVNMGTNQSIVNKSDSLLTSNYASLKHTFRMLTVLNDINLIIAQGLSEDSVAGQTLSIVRKLEVFEQPLKLQAANITEPGELQLSNNLQKSFDAWQHYLIAREEPFNWENFNRLMQELRNDIIDIYQMNTLALEEKNDIIKKHAKDVLKLQKNVGIIGLTIIGVCLILLPLYLVWPLDNLTFKLKDIYEKNYNKKINLKKGHEVAKLEEIIEKIIAEVKMQEKKD